MDILATALLATWSLCSATAIGLYAYTAVAVMKRVHVLRSKGARMVGGDYVGICLVGITLCLLFLAAAAVGVWAKGTPLAMTVGIFAIMAGPVFFFVHSLFLFRRMRGLGSR